MSTLTLDVPDGLKQELDQLTAEQQSAAEECVRETLRKYLLTKRLDSLTSRIRPHAEANGYETDDDVFRDVS